jgi:Ca2+-binding RTX toxin-like protein
MAITATFNPVTGVLTVQGDSFDNSIVASRDAAGLILINGGAVPIAGGTPTVANTVLIQMFGQDGADTITLNEASGALPAANLFGGIGNDVLTGGSGGDQLFGQGGNDTLFGKGGSDFLFGGDNDDTLTGGDGDDQMFGEGGNDRMIWNPGDDTDLMEGGADTDTAEVNAGAGSETFAATANGTRVRFDRIDPAPFALDIGTSENLVVNMAAGDDAFSATGNLAALIRITVDGGTGNDTILGSNGIDLLLGGSDNDFIDGQQGNDVAFLGSGDDTFQWDPGDGSDVVEGQDGLDAIVFNTSAASENIDLSANGGRALLFRDVGNIVMDMDNVETLKLNVFGGADDIVVNDLGATDITDVEIDLRVAGVGDAQPDSVTANGGAGGETVEVFASGGVVQILGFAAFTRIEGVEAIDSLIVRGVGGNDVISASALPAGTVLLTLDGGNDNDTLVGTGGVDTLLGGSGDDLVLGGGGGDTIQGNAADDTLDGGAGADLLDGGSGVDRASYLSASAGLTIDLFDPSATTGDAVGDVYLSIEIVAGSDLADGLAGDAAGNTLEGNGGNDTILGREGADTLRGGAGTDTLNGGIDLDLLEGGLGNDFYIVDDTGDTIVELSNQGYDTVNTTLLTFRLADNVERVNFNTSENVVGFGNSGDNRFQSLGGDDRFVADAGADIYSGGAGVDTIDYRTSATGAGLNFKTSSFTGAALGDTFAAIEKYLGSDTAADTMTGGGTGRFIFAGFGGNDKLTGGIKNDQLLGGNGDDALVGGADRDALDGGAGDDRLTGGAHNDVLTGGLNSDTFVFAQNSGVDRITDYDDAADLIDLTAFGFANFGAVLALASNAADGSLIINFGGGDKLDIDNFSLANFDAGDVLI